MKCENCKTEHQYWWDCEWQRDTATYGFHLEGGTSGYVRGPNIPSLEPDNTPLHRAGFQEVAHGRSDGQGAR